jgi:hypothetical protein
LFSVFNLRSKYEVPELVADPESNLTLLIVVKHVISFQVLEVSAFGCSMVEIVVNHVVDYVAKKLACHNCVDLGHRDDVRHRNDNKEEVDCETRQWGEDKAQAVHWEGVMDPVKKEVEG